MQISTRSSCDGLLPKTNNWAGIISSRYAAYNDGDVDELSGAVLGFVRVVVGSGKEAMVGAVQKKHHIEQTARFTGSRWWKPYSRYDSVRLVCQFECRFIVCVLVDVV